MPPHASLSQNHHHGVFHGDHCGFSREFGLEWMRYLVVVLIGVVAALFWQVNEVREEAERRVVRAVSHHLNDSLSIVMNRQFLDPNAREQIVDDQLQPCVWAMKTILPALNVGLPQLLNIKRHSHPSEWTQPDPEQLRQQQSPSMPALRARIPPE